MLGAKLIIVVCDNRGYGCINRLQVATGGAEVNNLWRDTRHETLPQIDFVGHARSLGAEAVKANSIAEFENAFTAARKAKTTQVIVIDTDPVITTEAGGAWWDVVVPAASQRPQVVEARVGYEQALTSQRVGD
jgi:3D-(3,5/4)-trihydroxycyclohexane-1,2-dione acylhydrolase (decyclizing)